MLDQFKDLKFTDRFNYLFISNLIILSIFLVIPIDLYIINIQDTFPILPKFLILVTKTFPKIPLLRETNSNDRDSIKLVKKISINLKNI